VETGAVFAFVEVANKKETSKSHREGDLHRQKRLLHREERVAEEKREK